MKFEDLYKLAVELGKNADPRGKKEVGKELSQLKADFDELKDKEKNEFDQEKLFNPYSDTRILCGDTDSEIKTILTGIDIDVGEMLLADKLSQKGPKIDLVISHHPSGRAYANFYEVMHMQTDILANYGVP
ncbi:MAG: NGG1p interacting factor NIF3, partial [bacterium]